MPELSDYRLVARDCFTTCFGNKWQAGGQTIETHYLFPPIPYRGSDWLAYRDPEQVQGWGATEAQAIQALLDAEAE